MLIVLINLVNVSIVTYIYIYICIRLYYNQSETKMVDSSEAELSHSSRNLSVVSDEDFEVSSSSEDSVTEDELEIEHGSAVYRPVCCQYHITKDRNFI